MIYQSVHTPVYVNDSMQICCHSFGVAIIVAQAFSLIICVKRVSIHEFGPVLNYFFPVLVNKSLCHLDKLGQLISPQVICEPNTMNSVGHWFSGLGVSFQLEDVHSSLEEARTMFYLKGMSWYLCVKFDPACHILQQLQEQVCQPEASGTLAPLISCACGVQTPWRQDKSRRLLSMLQ